MTDPRVPSAALGDLVQDFESFDPDLSVTNQSHWLFHAARLGAHDCSRLAHLGSICSHRRTRMLRVAAPDFPDRRPTDRLEHRRGFRKGRRRGRFERRRFNATFITQWSSRIVHSRTHFACVPGALLLTQASMSRTSDTDKRLIGFFHDIPPDCLSVSATALLHIPVHALQHLSLQVGMAGWCLSSE